jgi:hypothetical protein
MEPAEGMTRWVTSSEALCDFVETRHKEKIKVIKDIAAEQHRQAAPVP